MEKILAILTFVSMFLMLLCMFLMLITGNIIFGPIGAIIGLIIVAYEIITIIVGIWKGKL